METPKFTPEQVSLSAPEAENDHEVKETRKRDQTVIFDFDGTLADGQWALVETINELAVEFGYQQIKAEEIVELKQMGAKDFVTKRLHVPLWKMFKFQKRGREVYGEKIERIKLFEGLKEQIDKLKHDDYQIGIVSSNSAESISKFLKANGIDTIDFIYSGSSIFGKGKVIGKMLKERGLDPQKVILVGDEARDVEAAVKSGVKILSVGWGYNHKKALQDVGTVRIIEEPEQLESSIQDY